LASKTHNKWAKACKIADLGVEPRIFVDDVGAVHLMWIKRDEGIYHQVKTESCWGAPEVLVSDPMVREPWDVVFDEEGNLHIAYTRASKGGMFGEPSKPGELVYVEVTNLAGQIVPQQESRTP